MNWYQANATCHELGGFLAEIRSLEEQDYIELFIEGYNEYAIGLTDLTHKGTFVWMSDASVPEYTDWGSGQPNGDGDCVKIAHRYHIQSYLWKWYTTDCNFYHLALCQQPQGQND